MSNIRATIRKSTEMLTLGLIWCKIQIIIRNTCDRWTALSSPILCPIRSVITAYVCKLWFYVDVNTSGETEYIIFKKWSNAREKRNDQLILDGFYCLMAVNVLQIAGTEFLTAAQL